MLAARIADARREDRIVRSERRDEVEATLARADGEFEKEAWNKARETYRSLSVGPYRGLMRPAERARSKWCTARSSCWRRSEGVAAAAAVMFGAAVLRVKV